MIKSKLTLALSGALLFSTPIVAQAESAALETYAKIADQNYDAALVDAKALQSAIESFNADPSEATLEAAKEAWLKSRESYGTTEIFRLSAGPIDAEEGWVAEAYGALEGQLNAWPLDEHMIDYTVDADGQKTGGTIIDTMGEFTPGGEDAETVDVQTISVDALTALNENGGDANVSTGYHAIEFLLWGQDQDYANFVQDGVTNGAMVAGQRPLTDFTSDELAQRRKAYLAAAAQKLVADLEVVASAWDEAVDGNKGLYRAALLGQADDKNIDEATAIKQITGGMGMFLKSELANERIAVAVLTPSEEDEHSCFSDNTHRDIVTNYQGFKNVLLGTYNGEQMGEGFAESLSDEDKAKVMELIAAIDEKVASMDEVAKTKAHFDYQIHPESEYAQNIVSMKNDMRKLGDMMIIVAEANGVSLTEADVTDAEETQL